MYQKGFTPVFLLVTLAFVSIAGSIIYFKSQEVVQTNTNQQAAAPIISTSPAPSPQVTVVKGKITPTVKPTKPSPTSTKTTTSASTSNPEPTATPTSAPKTCEVRPVTIPTPTYSNIGTVYCEVRGTMSSCNTPATVNLIYGAISQSGTANYNDYVTNVQWDFDGNGTWDTPMDLAGQRATHTYTERGNYTVKMHLQTSAGLSSEVCTGIFTLD